MNLFDLHCDTAGECYNQKLALLDGDMHLNLCKGKNLDKWAQVFAIWIPDELRGEKSKKYFDNVLLNFKNEILLNNSKIKLCQDFLDFMECKNSNKCAAILACEGASPFADFEGAYRAKKLGVKLITFTWDGENEVGYGCQSGVDMGLKSAGKTLLRDMEMLNIAADVSHLNRSGFYDVVSSGVKVLASHSNCESVLKKHRKDSKEKAFACRRALDDEQIGLLIECGGLIGINFYKNYLGDSSDDGFEAVYRHMAHILDMGGENILAIGSDFDGCDIVPELSGVDKMHNLRSFLAEKGMNEEIIEKIFFENAENFFKTVLQ